MPAESTSKAEGTESVQNDTSKIKSLTQINLWPRFGCVGLFTGHALSERWKGRNGRVSFTLDAIEIQRD